MPLNAILKYPLILLTAFAATWLLTPRVGRLAQAIGMIDAPDERRIHRHPMPRGGGIAIIVGFHLACAALFFIAWGNPSGQLTLDWWWRFTVVTIPLMIAGIQDDFGILSMPMKLCWQLAAGTIAFQLGIRMGAFFGLHLPFIVDFGATVLWFLLVINAFNLIDGIDGLAAGLACIASLGLVGSLLLRREPGDALVLGALFGACLAFLRFNFYPARIFLGDTGSMFLGCALATMGLSTGAAGTVATSIAVPLLAVGVPLFDTLLAVWRRGVRKTMHVGNGILQPDLEHLHHRLLKEGRSQRGTAILLYGTAVALVMVGLASQAFASFSLGIYLLAFLAGSYVIMRHLARVELWDSAQAILRGLRRPRRKAVSVILYPVLDAIILSAALLVTIELVEPGDSMEVLKARWIFCFPVWAGTPFFFIFVGRTYRRVWSRARASEYAIFGVTVAAGLVAAAALANILYDAEGHSLFRFLMIMAGISLPLLSGMRLLFRVVQDLIPTIRRRMERMEEEGIRVLLYPAGFDSILYLRARSFDLIPGQEHRHIVGLLDEDSNLHGRYVHGFEVLGGIARLPEIVRLHHIDEIVVAGGLTQELADHLRRLSAEAGVEVYCWMTDLKRLDGSSHKWHYFQYLDMAEEVLRRRPPEKVLYSREKLC